jgi:hypothetical protein
MRARCPSTSVSPALWVAIARWVAPRSRHRRRVCAPPVGVAAGVLRLGLDREPVHRQAGDSRDGRIVAMRSADLSSGLPSGIHPSPRRPQRSSSVAADPPNHTGTGSVGRGRMLGSVDRVELAVERERILGPEPAHQLDLLGLAAAAVAEVLVEGLVLDGVPPDAHPELEAVARQDRELGSLLRDQHRLALREDQHRGHQFDGGGARPPRTRRTRSARGTRCRCRTAPRSHRGDRAGPP